IVSLMLYHLNGRSPEAVNRQSSIVNPLHPDDAVSEVLPHLGGSSMRAAAMARQYPLKVVVEQAFHRMNLFPPRIPADIARGVERLDRVRPARVIAGKKETIAVKQNHMAGGGSWSGGSDQSVIEPRGGAA